MNDGYIILKPQLNSDGHGRPLAGTSKSQQERTEGTEASMLGSPGVALVRALVMQIFYAPHGGTGFRATVRISQAYPAAAHLGVNGPQVTAVRGHQVPGTEFGRASTLAGQKQSTHNKNRPQRGHN
jgi:hypothetical protein